MTTVESLFSSVLAEKKVLVEGPLGESGDFGESQGLARVAGGNEGGERVANGGDFSEPSDVRSPLFASHSPILKRLLSEQPCGFSPDSPDSPKEGWTNTWSDDEIRAFQARRDRLMRWGRSEAEAEALAQRLTARDRDGDDRRMCCECSWLGDTGRCIAAASGRMPGVDRRHEPVTTILQRCEAFGLKKGLV